MSTSKRQRTAAAPAAKAKTRAKRPATKLPARANAASDWRLATMERLRKLILEADPAMVEERKWRKPTNPAGVPVFSHDGIVCTLESYKGGVKLTFMHGGSVADPNGLFTAGFGGTRRAIDVREGEMPDAAAFKALIKAAVARNVARS